MQMERETLSRDCEVLSVDLVDKTCKLCDNICYPSILIQVDDGICFVCPKCLAVELGLTMQEVEDYLETRIMHKTKSVYLDMDWVREGDISELIEVFKVIEDEDRQYVEFEGLQVVTRFISGLDKGLLFYTKDEIVEYLNFYGNDIELVLTLRSKFHEEPDNSFIRDVYISSRTKKLTQHQLRALYRDRRYSFMSSDTELFWDRLEDLKYEVDLLSLSDTGLGKLRGVVDDVLESGRYTDKQYAYLESQMDKLGV